MAATLSENVCKYKVFMLKTNIFKDSNIATPSTESIYSQQNVKKRKKNRTQSRNVQLVKEGLIIKVTYKQCFMTLYSLLFNFYQLKLALFA